MLPPTAQQDLWMGRTAVEMSLGGAWRDEQPPTGMQPIHSVGGNRCVA